MPHMKTHQIPLTIITMMALTTALASESFNGLGMSLGNLSRLSHATTDDGRLAVRWEGTAIVDAPAARLRAGWSTRMREAFVG